MVETWFKIGRIFLLSRQTGIKATTLAAPWLISSANNFRSGYGGTPEGTHIVRMCVDEGCWYMSG